MLAVNKANLEKSGDSEDIINIIDSFVATAATHDVHFKGYNHFSLNKFRKSSTDLQNQIKKSIKYSNFIAGNIIDINQGNSEVKMLLRACDDVNLEVPDDFIKKIRRGDIVEVYETETMIQIYRNLEFLKHCSYDLLTVSLTPFPELFERQKGFDEKILARANEVSMYGEGTESWNIEDHKLVEIMDAHNQVTLLKLGFIAPIKHKITGKRMAWASTVRAEHFGPVYKSYDNVKPLK
jgi:hypothetical protein